MGRVSQWGLCEFQGGHLDGKTIDVGLEYPSVYATVKDMEPPCYLGRGDGPAPDDVVTIYHYIRKGAAQNGSWWYVYVLE